MSNFTRSLFILTFLLFLFFGLPNIVNKREKKAFSTTVRLEEAGKWQIVNDSVELPLATFYNRGPLTRTFVGEHYRDMWATPVKLPVLDLDSIKGGLKITHLGGGQQTISLDILSSGGFSYTLRSVDKDPSHALPRWLYYSLARPLLRDQTSALNPFGALVVSALANTAGILQTKPVMYYVPSQLNIEHKYNDQITGRVMTLEIEPDNSWRNLEVFNKADEIWKSSDMLNHYKNNEISVDSLEYVKCRLFDILIGDWDRHAGQWAWAINDSSHIASPIPMDRDIAFFKFRDGWINKLAIMIQPKLQTFDSVFYNVNGYMKNGQELDTLLLSHVTLDQWLQQANILDSLLTDEKIEESFKQYPSKIRGKWGDLHTEILIKRKSQLPWIAEHFYTHLHPSDQSTK